MAEFAPTESQRAAIETRGGGVLVSAAAGSGKTKVLTERLLGYLTDPDDPKDLDSFLVITFTRAAAAELRSRIMDGVGRALAENPDNRRLRRQNALCQSAQIGTIHSFCQKVLRENCHLLGLAPDFRVADDDRANAMKEAALTRVLERRYQNMDDYPGFQLLADTVGAGRDDSRLEALVMNLHGKMQCHARPEKWAEAQTEGLKLIGASDAGETVWGREIMSAAKKTAEYWAGEMDELVRALAAGNVKIYSAYSPSVQDTAAGLRDFAWALEGDWDKARELAAIPFPRLGSLRDSPDPELSEYVKARRDECKKSVKAFAEQFAESSEKLLEDMRRTAPAMAALLALVLDFDREFSKDKRRAGLVDFNDLEHLTARLTADENGLPTPLARELSQRYTEIMVDEYQDVSEVQDLIFRSVSQEGKNLFMVGDVKQAISRFRLADPAIFTAKYDSYKDSSAAAEGEPRRVLLRENFRSRREIIDGANGIFAACMSRDMGEVDYDDAAALRCGASYPGMVPPPELLLIDTPAGDDDEAPDKVLNEARVTAAMIKKLVDEGTEVFDKGAARPMNYGDAAILLRSANAVGGVYRRALSELGIPVGSGQGGGFFTSIEVSCVMSLLAVIDNPRQDVPLIAVLRSPAVGFTADELSAVRGCDKRSDYYTALKKAAENGGKAGAFMELLARLRDAAPDTELGEFIWRIYNELDLPALCSAMTDGGTRLQNLMLLFEYAKKFEATGYRGVHRFVQWLRRLADRGQEPDTGGAQGVAIMSVHRSKGLEFPVVFLCDTGRRFNRQDSRSTVLVHPALGLGPKTTDLEKRIEYPTLARTAIKLRTDREMLSEEMRLLYVAVTRAKERLYITASMKDPAAQVEKLRAGASSPAPPELLRQAQCPAQWLIYAALANDIKLDYKVREDENKPTAEPAEPPAPKPDEKIMAELQRRLNFAYPHAAAVSLPSKVTATELKSRLSDIDPESGVLAPRPFGEFRAPDFSKSARPLTGARRGTATHIALQYMDFAGATKPGGAAREIKRLADSGLLSPEEAEAVDGKAIETLMSSPLGGRMRAAEKLNREFRFSVLLPAEDFFPDGGEDELLLQGAVDCWFEEADGVVIVDYKTDSVTAEETAGRAEFYAPQLRAYALAVTAVTGKPVKEAFLYFLRPGKAVKMEKKL